MPKATVSQETKRVNLKSCPGGFVELRQLSYYEMMHRRDIAAKMYTEQKVQTRRGKSGSRGRQDENMETMRAQLEVMNVAIMEFEFSKCIEHHNLEDNDGNLLDFSNPLSFEILDPKVGAEIGRHIDELNQEEEEDLDPFTNAPSSSSLDGMTLPKEGLDEN
jgi:hypothetical protein